MLKDYVKTFLVYDDFFTKDVMSSFVLRLCRNYLHYILALYLRIVLIFLLYWQKSHTEMITKVLQKDYVHYLSNATLIKRNVWSTDGILGLLAVF